MIYIFSYNNVEYVSPNLRYLFSRNFHRYDFIIDLGNQFSLFI